MPRRDVDHETCEWHVCENCGAHDDDSGAFCNDCGNNSYCCGCSCEEERDIGGVRFMDNGVRFHAAEKMKKQLSINPSTRFISAEIEVCGVRRSGSAITRAARQWGCSIVEDGSLPSTGFEINTAPASGDLFVRQISDLADALAAQRAHITDGVCGLHIHVDARDLTWYDMRRVVFMYEKCEPSLFAMIPESRRRNSYCVPSGRAFADAIRAGKGPKEMKEAMLMQLYGVPSAKGKRGYYRPGHKGKKGGADKYGGERYLAMNVHSWLYRGTLEFRFPPGTTNKEKITNWGMLMAGLVDTSNRLAESKILELKGTSSDVLKLCTVGMPKLPEWIDARIARYGPSVEESE